MRSVTIYTDGACKGNPGPGGWGAILEYNGHRKVISGRSDYTTNNRMELTAVLSALKALKEPCNVNLVSDSKYVCDSIRHEWCLKWQSLGWETAKHKAVPNKDLWQEVNKLINIHDIHVTWVKGHSGHPENEFCDALAVAAI